MLINFGIKDYFYLTGIIFYAFPLPILILGIVFFLLYAKNKAIKLVFLLVLIFLLFFWIKNYYFNHTPTNTEKTHSILFWNVTKQDDYNIKSLQELIRNKNIEAILLVEAHHKDNNFNTEFIKPLKAYHIEFIEGNMVIATKTKTTLLNYIEEYINYGINYLQIQLNQNLYSVIIVTVQGNPFHNKKAA